MKRHRPFVLPVADCKKDRGEEEDEGKKKSKKLRSHGPDRLSCSLRRSFITFLDKVKPMVFHVSPTDGFYSYRACYIDPRMPV